MGSTGFPEPRIDRSPFCCCSHFECQVRVVSCAGQSSGWTWAVASSISHGLTTGWIDHLQLLEIELADRREFLGKT